MEAQIISVMGLKGNGEQMMTWFSSKFLLKQINTTINNIKISTYPAAQAQGYRTYKSQHNKGFGFIIHSCTEATKFS